MREKNRELWRIHAKDIFSRYKKYSKKYRHLTGEKPLYVQIEGRYEKMKDSWEGLDCRAGIRQNGGLGELHFYIRIPYRVEKQDLKVTIIKIDTASFGKEKRGLAIMLLLAFYEFLYNFKDIAGGEMKDFVEACKKKGLDYDLKDAKLGISCLDPETGKMIVSNFLGTDDVYKDFYPKQVRDHYEMMRKRWE